MQEAGFMMTIGEKVSYIKGLCKGLEKDDKIIDAILDVLADIAENLNEVDEELDDVASVMTDLEESVCCLEDDVYGAGGYDSDYFDDSDIEEDIGEMYETVCPNCDSTIRFDYEQAKKGGMDCPNCGKKLVFEPDDEPDEL